MLNPSTPVEELTGHNVIQHDPGEGPNLYIGKWQLTWKAEGENTGYSFSIYETTLNPGQGLPLHKHPYPEFFYVLEGKLDFSRWNDDGEAEWITCGPGATVLAPPNAPHTVFNKGEAPARYMSVSTYHHERMLKDAVYPGGNMHFLPEDITPERFDRLFKSMEKNQTYVAAEKA